jgi:hypothetical protein
LRDCAHRRKIVRKKLLDDKLLAGANRGKYISVAAPGVDILVPAPENA